MSESTILPSWIKTASNHAVLNHHEVLLWMRLPSSGGGMRKLRDLVENHGFPPPRFGEFGTHEKKKWRVGDIRAWLLASEALEREISTPVGGNGISNDAQLAAHANACRRRT